MIGLVGRHLRSLGLDVVEASDGDTAWKLAQERVPDLVLLDVMMPGMSGWEVCKRLKGPSADAAFANTGVIMLTGIGESLNEMTSPLFAADAWLDKPFDFSDLSEKVLATLARYGKVIGAAAPAAKKPAAKKPAAKKPAAKKPAAKKPAAKKPAAKKPAAKKPAAKKPAKKS